MKNYSGITVILIAGGISKRMWPIQDKAYIPFLGKPLIYHALDQMARMGLKKIAIVGNDINIKAIEKLKLSLSDLSITPVSQNGQGMARALLSAIPYVKTDSILVRSPHDVVQDDALSSILSAAGEGVDGAILAKQVTQYFPGGYIKLQGNLISEIIEKPGVGKEPSNLVNIMLHYFKDGKKLAKFIQNTQHADDGLYENAISKFIQNGAKISTVPYQESWLYLKYPWHVLAMTQFFLAQIKKTQMAASVKIDSTAKIIGPVLIEKGVSIHPHATVVGPTYIGPNTIIGNNSLVRDSHIGANCVVGFSTEVVRSYVGSDTWFHTNYIGDSVVGNNVAMGSGGVTANIRLDEQEIYSILGEKSLGTDKNKLGGIIGDDVRIGVNASIMPGVKIGRGSFVGAGVMLTEDVRDGMFVSSEQKLKFKKNEKIVKAENRDKFRKKID